ncbi:ATP-binding protein [Cereibacter azotoformans]|uniref:ORC1/DEAH AAA+ ATPase domain-containing protein n=1 Tax=Cereibacter sphaeroides (strain ATCC 17025 / ATH 2.4.3) TaxID=349102 RepID=A4WSF9_CERS5|nr:ATP-binding protein [Cereibacter azotoformans]ULB09626.1 ATP-binding protein [Cereibacter azotoformans]
MTHKTETETEGLKCEEEEGFVDRTVVDARKPLKKLFYQFPRAKELRSQFKWVVNDYYTKAAIGGRFEARGILLTGPSRLGKSDESDRLISEFNTRGELMPDGRPARIVRCELSRKISWKELGVTTADAIGYPVDGRRNQSYIWRMVLEQAKRQGVIGIAYDECQHVFTEDGNKTNRIFLDSFKTLLKDSGWPLILILSGVPELAAHVHQEPQLRHLLRPVHFKPIDLDGERDANGVSRDMDELNRLAYTYAEAAGLCFDGLSNGDFFGRLSHACAGRWGLVIELVIDACVICKCSGATDLTIDHFVQAFAEASRMPRDFSPFTAPDYQDCFDQDKLLEILRRSDS